MNSDIRQAFETRIAAFASSQVPALMVAWENTTEVPSPDSIYLSVKMMPALTLNPSLGTQHDRLQGIYQINVHGLQNDGPAGAEIIADSLIALFPRGSMQQNGVVINLDSTGSRASGLNDQNGFFFIPVRFRYREDVLS